MTSLCRRTAVAGVRRSFYSACRESCCGNARINLQRSPLRPSAPALFPPGGGGNGPRVFYRGSVVVFGAERRLGTFRASSPRLDEHVMNLPELGDSISEGTVVQWCKSVGDEVQEDEVVAVVETDKVSVDVRSTHVGVVVKLFAAVDDVLEVGKPLCTIDGDEASVVRAKLEATQEEEDAKAPPREEKKPNIEDAYAGAFMAGADFVPPKKSSHEPLIKFVGKRSRLKEKEASEQADAPVRHRHSPGALDFSQIVGGAMFGRPPMSEEEMAAVDSGGAEAAPQAKK